MIRACEAMPVHTPARGATAGKIPAKKVGGISIHAPARGATCDSCMAGFDIRISIHAPAKGATRKAVFLSPNSQNFNPRSREGSDNPPITAHALRPTFQSTLPRRERPSPEVVPLWRDSISIHAPAKGATEKSFRRFIFPGISIHAPAKGATAKIRTAADGMAISIHAPAKGATYLIQRGKFVEVPFQSTLPRRERPGLAARLPGKLDFNPRSREGSDPNNWFRYFSAGVFQSTLPRRERPVRPSSASFAAYFNPRSREGSDAP